MSLNIFLIAIDGARTSLVSFRGFQNTIEANNQDDVAQDIKKMTLKYFKNFTTL